MIKIPLFGGMEKPYTYMYHIYMGVYHLYTSAYHLMYYNTIATVTPF